MFFLLNCGLNFLSNDLFRKIRECRNDIAHEKPIVTGKWVGKVNGNVQDGISLGFKLVKILKNEQPL